MAKRGYAPRPVGERFWEKVDKLGPNDCWCWTDSLDRDGYGHLFVGSKAEGTNRLEKAHRFSWEIHNRPLRSGEQVRHYVCDNPSCVNPRHLKAGSAQDNVDDMRRKGRGYVIPPMPGERNPAAKLTEDDVRAIRADSRAQREIAEDYGVTQTQVSKIKTRRSWKHVK